MGTKYRGDEGEVRALNAFIKLQRAASSTASRTERRLTDSGLTVSQFTAMEALFHLGPLCQKELGEKLLKSTGNITMVVDNLEKHGLARREREVKDRRYVTVHLTEAGVERIREMMPAHVADIVREMGTLSPDEQEELGRLCRKLGKGEATQAT